VDVARYAGASGDFNPLHLDAAAASAAGYDQVFVMGLLPASVLATYLADSLGIDNIRSFAVRYHQQVWLGDVVECSGVVEDGGPGLLSVTATCATESAGTVLSATAVFAR
jgi:acyl dehydratase